MRSMIVCVYVRKTEQSITETGDAQQATPFNEPNANACQHDILTCVLARHANTPAFVLTKHRAKTPPSVSPSRSRSRSRTPPRRRSPTVSKSPGSTAHTCSVCVKCVCLRACAMQCNHSVLSVVVDTFSVT
jgi:hypothetical protein